LISKLPSKGLKVAAGGADTSTPPPLDRGELD
jgi:hypothetical protein